MPPAANSRSSTYLPNIWGNTRPRHRTAAALCVLLTGCAPEPEPGPTLEISAHWWPACRPEPRPSAPPSRVVLSALGDFDAEADTTESLEGDAQGALLVVPPDTAAVELRVTDGFRQWVGLGTRASDSMTIDASLFPERESCTLLSEPDGLASSGQAFGFSEKHGVLLATGGFGPARAASIDLGRAAAAVLGRVEGPRTLRANATVTGFGEALLVAGGVDPDSGDALDSADVYDPVLAAFEADRIELESPRRDHAAVVLASGETLLVGGRDEDGRALRTLETISPLTRRYAIGNVATLTQARIRPTALRLTDDRILVAGGVDADGRPVATVEWLAPDASRVVRSVTRPDFPPSRGRAFAAMPGGGALAVGGCEIGPLDSLDSCARTGSAYWITPEGTIDPLPSLDANVDASVLELIPASDGEPFLLARVRPTEPGRTCFDTDCTPALRRFDPWSGRFEFLDRVPERLPRIQGTPEAPTVDTTIAVDRGAFVWLEQDTGVVRGYRHGTRGPFAQDVAPLLVSGTDHVVPARAARCNSAFYTAFAGGFTPALFLVDPATEVAIADTVYSDLRLRIDLAACDESFSAPECPGIGTAECALPLIRLGSVEIGGPSCRWPERIGRTSVVATVIRRAEALDVELDGRGVQCDPPEERVSVRLASPGEPVAVTRIEVSRAP